MSRDGDTAPIEASTRGYDFHTLYLVGTEFAHPVTGEPCHTTTYGRGYNLYDQEETEPAAEKYMGQPVHILMHPGSCPTSREEHRWSDLTDVAEGDGGKTYTVVSHLCEWEFEGTLDTDLDRFMTTDARPKVQGTYRILYDEKHVTGFEPLKLVTDDDPDTSEAPTSEG